MGVLNITPDSFSDGGQLYRNGRPAVDRAIDRAATMIEAGTHWLDIGGESTRPGAQPPALDEELARVLPVIEALARRFATPISVDTSQPQVIRHAATAGAQMVNDVRALQRPGALQAAADSKLAVCLMHMQGEPDSMQQQPAYNSVVQQVRQFLEERIAAAQAAGIAPQRICIDPGFGFGKTLEHNLQLLHGLPALTALGYPLLVGFSRKSMLAHMTDRPLDQRQAGTTVLNTLALERGARIFRVHDLPAAADMLRIWYAMQNNRPADPK
ncbi:MAG: dihydropteroate synthase [Cellvibrionales bacterium]|nr:dihydropteroate synthase [Cellvibrionales bacterium]